MFSMIGKQEAQEKQKELIALLAGILPEETSLTTSIKGLSHAELGLPS